ncbi:ubiquitin-associated domain-containing protein 1-like isoform X1 [Dinothrombium tinctorium]|uniref:Ubiquitin-associated domain-containing protein 1-like isoform X1 n=1 Tax=Dinothrombium tinctorium TaxID=1965070 RepID=A0A443QHF0_9ACAR|nr:ubiquitin-associated domain-containing protein 1-like isoform X1 [Dinothrombium tinctorium]
MHVEETGAFGCPTVVKIEMVNAKGESVAMEVSPELTIDKLKMMAITSFSNDPLSVVKIGHQFKLISINKKKTLIEEASVRDEDIADGDILLLLSRYPLSNRDVDSFQKEICTQSPSEIEINEATSSVEPKNINRKVPDFGVSLDFQRELRKILISLVDYSEKLLRNHADVYPILKNIKLDGNQEKKKEDDGIDMEALKQLTDMGFPCERAKRALKLNNMSSIDAMDWLLAYESSSSAVSVPSTSTCTVFNNENTDVYARVPAIVECYRAFKRNHFKPNMKAFNNLKQMGFDDNEVLDALWIHSNNEVSACEWLLSDRKPKYEDLQRGLKVDNPIYKAVINNPTVQLGLVKPKIFFAFLQLIEEPNSTARWLSDAETSPVLSQIFRIYHSEKHAGDDPLSITPESENMISINADSASSEEAVTVTISSNTNSTAV